MKNMFSMFTFYKYLFTRDDRKYELAMDSRGVVAVMTPLIIFIVSMIAFTFMSSISAILPVTALIGTMINFLLVSHTKLMGYEILREQEEELERLAREAKIEEARRRWDEYVKNKEQDAIRQARARAQREQKQREFERQQRERYEEEMRRRYSNYYEWSNRDSRATQTDSNMTNAIKLLGLKGEFTKSDVKSAYRNLSKIHHPDCGGTDENFKRLNKAYNYVMDRI